MILYKTKMIFIGFIVSFNKLINEVI